MEPIGLGRISHIPLNTNSKTTASYITPLPCVDAIPEELCSGSERKRKRSTIFSWEQCEVVIPYPRSKDFNGLCSGIWNGLHCIIHVFHKTFDGLKKISRPNLVKLNIHCALLYSIWLLLWKVSKLDKCVFGVLTSLRWCTRSHEASRHGKN